MKKKQKLNVYEYVVKESSDYDYFNLKDMISELSVILEKVPEEYRDDVKFEIFKYYEYGDEHIGVNIFYKRLETNEEYELRIKKEVEVELKKAEETWKEID